MNQVVIIIDLDIINLVINTKYLLQIIDVFSICILTGKNVTEINEKFVQIFYFIIKSLLYRMLYKCIVLILIYCS